MNENLKQEIIEISRIFNIKKLILFGSAMKSFENANDVDFACEGITGKSFLRFGSKLEELLNKPVDLIMIEQHNRFVDEILKDGIVIYES